jgi:4-hydroxybenzoate polyprenyltransferase
MPGWLTDPLTIVVLLFVALVATAFGLARREPWWAIAAAVIGVSTIMGAVRWGGEIGEGAELAVGCAAIGASLWTMAVERVRAQRRQAA